MLLEKIDGGFHRADLRQGSVFDHFDISQVSHDLHKEFLLLLSLSVPWKVLDTSGDLPNEGLDVLNLLHGVVEQEVDVSVDPKHDGVLELLDQRSGVDSEPSDVNGVLHLIDLVLDASEHCDLLVELLKRRLLGLHTGKNLR